MSDSTIARLARRFVDIEAIIEEEEYDEQDKADQDEDMGAFIDNDDEPAEGRPQRVAAVEEAPNEFWENLLHNAHSQAGAARRQRRQEDDPYIANLLPFVPKDTDYPLWRVPCRREVEDEAVISLMKTALPKHELRSAFARDSIPGYVYLECTMNTDLCQLLDITPGLRGFGHRRREAINVEEYAAVLDDGNNRIKRGDWVSIRHGLYKGDLGLVDGADIWGVSVLLVPRLSPSSRSSQKRKATTPRPEAELLDVVEQSRSSARYHVKPIGENKFRIGRLDFDHGLLKKYLDLSSIACHPTDIDYRHFELFKFSQHPRINISSIPRPREWAFQVGDRVKIISTSRIGFITVVETFYAEVDCSVDPGSVEDEICVPWNNVFKFFEIGNQVEILNGRHQGIVGWITNIIEDKSTVSIPHTEMKKIIVNSGEELDCLNNNLRYYISPLHLPVKDNTTVALKSTGIHWWTGREVTIMKKKHPNRTERGRIIDVIPTADKNVSKLLLELKAYRPYLPGHRLVIEAKDVVDLLTQKRLEGPEPEDHKKKELIPPRSSYILRPYDITSGSQTPQHEQEPNESDPAWDPTAPHPSGPSLLDSNTRLPNSLQPALSSRPRHVFLNPLFAGFEFKAFVHGGDFKGKECQVEVSYSTSEPLFMSAKRQRSVVRLPPDWVVPKSINARLDNNLLAIISGPHSGKLGRRIHHLDTFTGVTAIILAIVQRHENYYLYSDKLTGENVEIPPNAVAIVVESLIEKQSKKSLMKDLRAKWQGR